ncbi:hypothetical protein [Clostridium beijerinckii]|nr:hypothetical protein [Clostridium beijerinckii]
MLWQWKNLKIQLVKREKRNNQKSDFALDIRGGELTDEISRSGRKDC